MNLTGGHLRQIGRRAHCPLMDDLADAINRHFPAYGIANRKLITWVLANAAEETGGFTTLEENLNYSEKGLIATFPYYRKRPGEAKADARKPRTIANKVYNDKNRARSHKLGNTAPDDGWLHRGSGLGQTTGKDNFREVQNATGIPCLEDPELLRQADAGTEAIAVFIKNRMSAFMARVRADDMAGFRRIWNGGSNGLDNILNHYLPRAERVLSVVRIDGRRMIPGPEDRMIRVDAGGLDDGETYITVESPRPMIALLQRELNERGYKCGAVDGLTGPATNAAARNWCEANELPPHPWEIPVSKLEASGPYRAAARAALTDGEVHERLVADGSRSLGQRARQAGAAALALGGAGSGVAGGGTPDAPGIDLTGQLGQVQTKVDMISGLWFQVQSMLAPLQGFLAEWWPWLLGAVAVYLFFEARQTRKLRIARFRAGDQA